MMSVKNAAAASGDLGLGDQLQSQVESELAERRKKLMSQMKLASSPGGQPILGPATQSLFNMTGGMGG